MDVTHKQEYRIRELETRSVTLFPGRAQVHRQIKDVPLKAGENQITIIGLTPTVDQDSIKVEGTGSAIITDMAVELLPHREIFEDVYPEYDDDDGDSSDSDPDSSSEGDEEEERANAILDSYGKLMTTDRQNTAAPDVKIDEGLATYRVERENIFADIWDGNVQHREVKDKLQRLRKEEGRLLKQYRRETAKADKVKRREARAKQKEQQKAARKQQEVRKEQARVRKERESFWPKKVYSIRVTLDATAFTPGSSRRSSIASDVELVSSPTSPEKSSDNELSGSTCDLSISYVTTDAYWSPAYDMALSTTANTGHVCFDAQLTNRTAETWSNCKITLSTPQADFSGLHDTIPTVVPWRVRLTGGRAAHSDAYYSLRNDIMFSRDEQSHRAAWADKQTGRTHAQQPRAELFGVLKSQAKSPRGAVVESLMVAADEAKEVAYVEESDEEMGFGLFDGDEEPPRIPMNESMPHHT
ncbi:uncharacterized protein PG986_004982 [Apiospora aurea]|uniref:DUF4139 domain-containing protein n=1 Tax=Apiospora aurea TaxID=335848 RepID=A0ABR1QG98_9PEZI